MPALLKNAAMNNPPARKPFFSDPMMGGEVSLSPDVAFQVFVNGLGVELEAIKNWKLGNHRFVCIDVMTSGQFLEAEFLFDDGQKQARLQVSRASTGWIKAAVTTAQGEIVFYIERTYEEWEFWPANNAGQGEAPGRISKRFSWAQFEAKAWPELSSPDGGQFITIESD